MYDAVLGAVAVNRSSVLVGGQAALSGWRERLFRALATYPTEAVDWPIADELAHRMDLPVDPDLWPLNQSRVAVPLPNGNSLLAVGANPFALVDQGKGLVEADPAPWLLAWGFAVRHGWGEPS